jgi:hypothetical protein
VARGRDASVVGELGATVIVAAIWQRDLRCGRGSAPLSTNSPRRPATGRALDSAGPIQTGALLPGSRVSGGGWNMECAFSGSSVGSLRILSSIGSLSSFSASSSIAHSSARRPVASPGSRIDEATGIVQRRQAMPGQPVVTGIERPRGAPSWLGFAVAWCKSRQAVQEPRRNRRRRYQAERHPAGGALDPGRCARQIYRASVRSPRVRGRQPLWLARKSQQLLLHLVGLPSASRDLQSVIAVSVSAASADSATCGNPPSRNAAVTVPDSRTVRRVIRTPRGPFSPMTGCLRSWFRSLSLVDVKRLAAARSPGV